MVRLPKTNLDKLNKAYLTLKCPSVKYFNIAIIIICIVLVGVLNSQNPISILMKNTLFEINSSVVKILNKPFEMTDRAKIFVDERFYQKRIRFLEEQNIALENTIMMIEVENREVKQLKELLNYSISNDYKLVTTKLLKSSLNLASQDFLIPVGFTMGINSNAYAVDGIGLIGKVIEVGKDSAKVRMINSINSKTPIILSISREQAILIGNSTLSNKLPIIHCSNIGNVQDGELAITSGNGSIYPYGIVVGKVIKNDNEIYIQTLFDVNKLEFVKVYYK